MVAVQGSKRCCAGLGVRVGSREARIAPLYFSTTLYSRQVFPVPYMCAPPSDFGDAPRLSLPSS